MTAKYRTTGFVFKKEDRNEADQVFSVFTRDFGRVEINAKAIRKITSKLRPGIDIFSFSEIEFIQGKNNKTLTDAARVRKINFKEAGQFQAASQISELLDNFIKGQEKDSKTFDLIDETFQKFAARKIIYYYFLWNFLSAQGYHLEAEICSMCRNRLDPQSVYFSAKEGGVICKECSGKVRGAKEINSDIVKILRLILNKKRDIILRLKVGEGSRELLEEVSKSAVLELCPS